jgi:hypothetical protein
MDRQALARYTDGRHDLETKWQAKGGAIQNAPWKRAAVQAGQGKPGLLRCTPELPAGVDEALEITAVLEHPRRWRLHEESSKLSLTA